MCPGRHSSSPIVDLSLSSIFLDTVRLRDRAAALRSVKSALHYPHLLYDLALRLIIAPDGMSFITSDHPAVFLNQAFFEVIRDSEITGTASKGLQIFLPISPELLLIAFDRDFYRVGNRKNLTYQLDRHADCDLINALQILNSEENVYFGDEKLLPAVRALAERYSAARTRINERAKPTEIQMPGGGPGYLLISRNPVIPFPGPWSFCKRRRPVSRKDFCVRNPDLCRLVREHMDHVRSTDRRISFDDWLAERRMKAMILSA